MTPSREQWGRREVEERDRRYGFFGISYHFVIERDGRVEPGRSLQVKSPHGSDIAICLIGGAEQDGSATDNYTDNQKTAMVGLIHKLQQEQEDVNVQTRTPTVEQKLLDSIFNT